MMAGLEKKAMTGGNSCVGLERFTVKFKLVELSTGS